MELAMESARIRHNMALGRPTAVHLFSDYLPFHRELKARLIQRKLDRDFTPLNWLSESSVANSRTPTPKKRPASSRPHTALR
jgi:hypothetical protein